MCTARRAAGVGNGNDRAAVLLPAVPHGKKASASLFPPRNREERLGEQFKVGGCGQMKSEAKQLIRRTRQLLFARVSIGDHGPQIVDAQPRREKTVFPGRMNRKVIFVSPTF